MAKMGIKAGASKVGALTVVGIIAAATLIALAAGYAVHKLRMRHVMQNEIRDIMCARPSNSGIPCFGQPTPLRTVVEKVLWQACRCW